MSTKKQSRYPGIRAFEKEERRMFFGREEESKLLFSQIKAQNLVVLFAKSGIGKSSLVNASVWPFLEQGLFCPIKIRFQGTDSRPVENFKMALSPYVDQALLERRLKDQQTIPPWEYLRACRFQKEETILTPILVLDQFEEFFDHPIEHQNELLVELADMVSRRLPNRIQEQLRSIPFTERNDEDLYWHNPIPVKVLLIIRSDRIGLLDNLSSEIPSILQNRFQLKPLNQSAARQAIVEPACLASRRFVTPPFEYNAEVLDKILRGLSNEKGEIEPFQLQLLCQYIEKQIQQSSMSETSEPLIVSEAFFKNEKGFEAALNVILNNYYENELADLSETERIKARKFIEEGLIISGRRAGLTEGVEKEKYQIDRKLLTKLLDSRLIRQENTHLGKSFEISHDTLVAPILESYEKRREEEAKKERSLQQQKERKRLISALALALFGFSLAAIAMVFYWQADQAKELAQQERAKASEALIKFQEKRFESTEDRYNRLLSSGENYALQNDFVKAESEFARALQILRDFAVEVEDNSIVQQIDGGGQKATLLIQSTRAKKNRQAQFTLLVAQGDSLENNGERYFIEAQKKYLAAKNIDYNNVLADGKLYQIKGKLEIAFLEFVKNGDVFYRAEGYDFALQNYEDALRIKPNNVELKQKIRRCKNHLN